MAGKRKQTKNRKQVRRTTRHFQLRVDHPTDTHVGEILDYAKSQRREVTLIRDAVQLFYALEQGDMTLLLDKFPFVGEALTKQTPPAPADGGGQLDEIKGLLEMIAAQQKPPGGLLMQSAAMPTMKAIAVPKAEVKQAAPMDASEIADNFLAQFS
ncbi:MAG: hypothetical protein H0X30_17820 [Anaerolineae bacterium]|nr:hypothetical protein [Anaerolineae bacterium]